MFCRKKMNDLNYFEKIESELSLEKSECFGVRWWDLWRYPIYNKYLGKKKVNRARFSISIKRLLLGLLRLKVFLYKKNPIFILRHPRFKIESDRKIDIYTEKISEDLKSRGFEIVFFENPTPQKRALENKTYPLDFIKAFSLIFSSVIFYIFAFKDFSDIEVVLKELGLNAERGLVKRIVVSIIGFKIQVFLLRFFFNLCRPSSLIVVVSSGNEALICAAKLEKVPVFEMQHGSPSRGKLNYDYTSIKSKKYFPDFFLSFGRYFTQDVVFPVECKKIIEIGYPFLCSERKKHYITGKNRYRFDLLIISQPDCDDYICSFLKRFIKECPSDFRFLVQLHPQYFSRKNPYEDFVSDRFVVQDSISSSLYNAFNQSKAALTVYSTAIYEAYYFGLDCYILRGKNCFMDRFINYGAAASLSYTDGYFEFINKKKQPAQCVDIFKDYSTIFFLDNFSSAIAAFEKPKSE